MKKCKLFDNQTDADQPEAYQARFEELVRDAEIPKEDWCRRLRPSLTRNLNLHQRYWEDLKQDYDKLKEAQCSRINPIYRRVLSVRGKEQFVYSKIHPKFRVCPQSSYTRRSNKR